VKIRCTRKYSVLQYIAVPQCMTSMFTQLISWKYCWKVLRARSLYVPVGSTLNELPRDPSPACACRCLACC